MNATAIRPNIAPLLPSRFATAPIDHRGYPVPWFVTLKDEDGRYEFRVIEPERYLEAARRKVCWICGHKLGSNLAFAVGPMCGINRISGEPPQHLECAEFAVRVCPFMLLPRAQRRDANLPTVQQREVIHVDRNPGVTLVWSTRSARVVQAPNGQLLWRMGEPTAISFWREGRTATRAEIDESIESGCPILRNMAIAENALPEYESMKAAFVAMLPVADA